MINHLRLGLYRRNRRDLSLHLRRHGKSCLERMHEIDLVKLQKMLIKLIFVILEDISELDLLQVLIMMYIHCGKQLKLLRTPFLGMVDLISRDLIHLESFTDQQVHSMTGFTKIHITSLMAEIALPPYFLLGRGKICFYFSSIF